MRSIEFTTDNPSSGEPTWQEIDDFLAENLNSGQDEAQTTTYGDGTDGQDGVITSGSFMATGNALPTIGERHWFRFTDEQGREQVTGGERGCRVVMEKTGLRPIDGGPPYMNVSFGASGYEPGSNIDITTPA